MHFVYKWRKKWRFSHRVARVGLAGRLVLKVAELRGRAEVGRRAEVAMRFGIVHTARGALVAVRAARHPQIDLRAGNKHSTLLLSFHSTI